MGWRRRGQEPDPFDEPAPEPPPLERDWSALPDDEVPPWRRADRERVAQLRSEAAEPAEPANRQSLARRARELRRLVDLHREGVITDAELVEAARTIVE